MSAIRIKEWTKNKLREIYESESHSSYDSVIKSLLKDRQFAQNIPDGSLFSSHDEADLHTVIDKKYDYLSALSEINHAEEGILFIWCPNCRNEIAHVVTQNPVSFPVFEVQCQECLSDLNHHGLVVVEIGYPVEERIVDGKHLDDLRSCIIDYWDRTLRTYEYDDPEAIEEIDKIIWKIFEYDIEFGWDWPDEVPIVSIKPNRKYVNKNMGEGIKILQKESNKPNSVDAYRIERWDRLETPAEATEEIISAEQIVYWLTNRELYIT